MEKCSIKRGRLSATILSFGAILHELWIPDKNNTPVNTVAGLPQLSDYNSDEWFRGAVVGPYAGRLSNPVTIKNQRHTIRHTTNYPLLHGGAHSWAKQFWRLKQLQPHCVEASLTCAEESKEFPGSITVTVRYELLENGLRLSYEAFTTAPTPINSTNHAYFNLGGDAKAASHLLTVNAHEYLALDAALLPTGEQIPTKGSPYDFTKEKAVNDTTLDHYFISPQPRKASYYHPSTGIQMDVFSDQFGIVIFRPPHFEALCFETQAPSDATRFDTFPDCIATPEHPYKQETSYLFHIR